MVDAAPVVIQKTYEDLKEQIMVKDSAKEWAQEIAKEEQIINEKFDKEIKTARKRTFQDVWIVRK